MGQVGRSSAAQADGNEGLSRTSIQGPNSLVDADAIKAANTGSAPTGGLLNGQQGWAARAWNVATTAPANGAQHIRATSLASPTSSTYPLAISPNFTRGDTLFATISANLRISRTTNGASWRFNPQDPDAGMVTTIVQFDRAAARDIQAIQFDSAGNGTFVNTGAQWPVDTYFNFKVISNRATGALKLCVDGAQIYSDPSGAGTAGLDIVNLAVAQTTGSGQTASNTFDVDDLVVEYQATDDCVAGSSVTWEVTPSVGTPSGSISPNTPQTVDDGDTATFTLTADAGYEIDNVGGTCGGTLSGNSYETDPVTADCTVIGNFKAASAGSLVCFSPNHTIAQSVNGTYIRWEDNTFSDTGSVTGWNFNPWGSTNLYFYFNTSTGSGGVSSSTTGGNYLVLNAGDTVGPSDTFEASMANPVNWNPGADGYLGFKFDCTAGTCYGYAHMETTGPTGHPAVLDDYCYDADGNSIQIPTASPDPNIKVNPLDLSSIQAPNDTETRSLTIRNTGGDDLIWTIAEESGSGGTCSSPSDVTWLSAAPTGNTTVPGGSDTVTVTLNSAGMSAGTYNANLCINSDDPDAGPGNETGLVIVPVTMEVMEPIALSCNGPTEGFELGVPPVGWGVNTAFPSGAQWKTIAGSGETGNYTNGTGGAATASSDKAGNGAYDTWLMSPAFDLTGAGSAKLVFTVNYQNLTASDHLDVDITTDGGTTWTNIQSWAQDLGTHRAKPGFNASLDLSSYLGQSGLQLRWRYYNPSSSAWDWYAQIDDVGLDCVMAGDPPDIDVSPGSLSSTQDANTTATRTLDIRNKGGSDLTWTIDEEPAAVHEATGGSPNKLAAPAPAQRSARQLRDLESVSADVVQDGGFEDGTPNSYWDEYSYNFGTTLCTVGDCGTGTGTGPRSGTWWSWFGGIAAYEEGSLGQDVTIPSGATNLTFWVEQYVCSGDATDYLEVTVDGTSLWSTTGAATECGTLGYRQVTVDISAYADGGTHTLEFYSEVQGSGTTNFFVDDVAIDSGSGSVSCTSPAAVSWLSVNPASGTTAMGGVDSVTVTFDSTGLSAGTYNANLCIESDDPDTGPGNGTELVAVPVKLTVTTAPNIDVDPLSMTSTQEQGTTTTQTLNVANTGTADLTWSIDEENTTSFPAIVRGLLVAQPAAEKAGTAAPAAPAAATAPATVWKAPADVLYDNGPLVTHPGAGAGGADASALQTALGLTTYGAGNQLSAGNRVADDFTVPAGGWTIDSITFFGYQTGSTTTSTMTSINLRIWDGVPGAAGSNVVFGDTATNRMTSSSWANMYRVLDTGLTDTARPVMASTAAVDTFLPAGTYWVDWQVGGTLSSGPWAPPISIVGQTTTGDAWQYTVDGWAPLMDETYAQGLPFIIEGTTTPPECATPSTVSWLSFTPASGTNVAGTDTDVTVTFNSTSLSAGTYTANLCVASNDPDAGPGNGTKLVVVPVTLTVEEQTTFTLYLPAVFKP